MPTDPNKPLFTPKAAALSEKYPHAPLGLLFALQDLERENIKMRDALQFIADTVDTSQTCSPGNEAIALRAMDALST